MEILLATAFVLIAFYELEALLGRRVRPQPEGRPAGWRKVERDLYEE